MGMAMGMRCPLLHPTCPGLNITCTQHTRTLLMQDWTRVRSIRRLQQRLVSTGRVVAMLWRVRGDRVREMIGGVRSMLCVSCALLMNSPRSAPPVLLYCAVKTANAHTKRSTLNTQHTGRMTLQCQQFVALTALCAVWGVRCCCWCADLLSVRSSDRRSAASHL